MTLKTDEPTGVNSNGATANERKRVGVNQYIIVRFDFSGLTDIFMH